jgi:hypothetical protein
MPPLATLEERREYQRQWIAKQRSDWLQDKNCARCSSTDRLEIDHIDPSTKVTNRIWSWSRERREAELVKCQVLCRDCHVVKTAEDAKRARGHNRKRYYRDRCRCNVCSEAVQRYNERKNEMRRAVRSANLPSPR